MASGKTWRAVSQTLATRSRKWRDVDDEARVLWLQIVLVGDAYGTLEGGATAVWVRCTERLGWSLKKTTDALAKLVAAGLVIAWRCDDELDWVHVVDFDEHQPSESLRKRGARKSAEPPADALAAAQGRTEACPQIGDRRTEIGEDDLPIVRPAEPDPDDIRSVFDHWVAVDTETGGGTDRRTLTPKRRGHINARRSDGFTVEQLCRVIDAFCRDPWHLGDNPQRTRYTGLQTLLKSAEKVEAGLQLADKQERTAPGSASSLVRPAARAVEAVQ